MLLAFRVKANRYEIGVGVGLSAVYLLLFLRTTMPAERSHLIEYSVVAALIFSALWERKNNGEFVPMLPLLAIGTSTFVGIVDELIQLFLPNRVFDPVDILFNFLASVMAVIGMVFVTWIAQKRRSLNQNPT